MVWLPLGGELAPKASEGGGMGNGEGIDSSNRYALSPLWGALPGESLPLTDIVI